MLGAEPLRMFVQLCDLRLKALTMGAVFGRVDRLSLERGMFRPKRLDFLPKPIVFHGYVFALAHLRIVARCQKLCRVASNIVPVQADEVLCVIPRLLFLRALPWL